MKHDGETAPERQNTSTRPLSVYSAELFGSDGEVVILHHGRRYRLYQGSGGRLELTGPEVAGERG